MNKGVLIILDGYGEGKSGEFNAVKNAKTPTLNALKSKSYSLLKADGEAVGLFAGAMGGSEVGHTTIGAGRVIKSTAKKINDDIQNNKLKNNPVFAEMLKNLKRDKGDLHLVGLMSDKNVHSNVNHMLHIIDNAKSKAKNIYLHLITDGRDCGVKDSLKYLKKVKAHIKKLTNVVILSVLGRFYAMDREGNLDRTNLAFKTMFEPVDKLYTSVENYIKNQHENKVFDEYIKPAHFASNYTKMKKQDYVFIFNFREDRIRQISKMIKDKNLKLITFAEVENCVSLYKENDVKMTLSEYLSKNKLSQIKISESTKYAHVTYYLNGGKEAPFYKEDRIHVPTIKVDNFAKTPKMQAGLITKHTVEALNIGYDAVIVNFSNPDMIGHTGDYLATKKAIEYVDKCVNKIIKTALKTNHFVLITADHGNSESMKKKNGEIDTAHTTNKVFCAVKSKNDIKLKKYGELKDVAPTFIDLMGLKKNPYFEGDSLVVKS